MDIKYILEVVISQHLESCRNEGQHFPWPLCTTGIIRGSSVSCVFLVFDFSLICFHDKLWKTELMLKSYMPLRLFFFFFQLAVCTVSNWCIDAIIHSLRPLILMQTIKVHRWWRTQYNIITMESLWHFRVFCFVMVGHDMWCTVSCLEWAAVVYVNLCLFSLNFSSDQSNCSEPNTIPCCTFSFSANKKI